MIPVLLERIIGQPIQEPVPPDWRAIADQTGLDFPSDYRSLAERYTALAIFEFFIIYHPTSRQANLLAVMEPQLEMARVYLRWTDEFAGGYDPETGENIPPGGTVDYNFYPETGGLLPWGVTANGQKCLWLTHENPEKWTVIIADDVVGWWHYKGSMTAFLADLISEKFTCPAIGEDFIEEWFEEDDVKQIG
ncbi:hypothetical protein ACQEU3_37420 [Spirillospora sp. CA-253888]